jgi:hypothetical protein
MGIVETLNALGVALSANSTASPKQQQLGSHLTISALVIQLIVIMLFMWLAGTFHRRCVTSKVLVKPVMTLLTTLYVSMTLILVRCIYRLAEHAGNTNVNVTDLNSLKTLSPILRYEAYFYIFEATLMLINSILWNVFNPGRYLPTEHRIYLGRDGHEVEGEEDSDDRPLLAKTAHVLTFGIMFRKKPQAREIQELVEPSRY